MNNENEKDIEEEICMLGEQRETLDKNVMLMGTVKPNTKLKLGSIGTDERQWRLEFTKRLNERVVGQDEAVKAVVRIVCAYRAGFGRREKPIGSFLFLGTTGIGKKKLANALVEHLFSDDKHMIRINMSEYMKKQSEEQLFGGRRYIYIYIIFSI